MRGWALIFLVAMLLPSKNLFGQPATSEPIASMEWITIQAGEYLMGCTGKCNRNEPPPQTVRIPFNFEVTKYQVTHEQWKFVTGKYRREWIPGPKHPAIIRWEDASDFVKRMNQKRDGYRYRLLTDAEWEYIARAQGTVTTTEPSDRIRTYGQIIWHDEPVIELVTGPGAPQYVPSCGMDLGQMPCPAPTRFPNAWGVYDMLGDTPEWVNDWYGPKKGGGHLVRGTLEWFLRGDGIAILLEPPRVWWKNTGDAKKSRYGFRIVRGRDQ
jgi:formylglycine-generating enzyme required for sulfatase activity